MKKDPELKLKEHLADIEERKKAWTGSAEKNMEPDYEILRKHVEVWVHNNHVEMAHFLEEKRTILANNKNQFGAMETSTGVDKTSNLANTRLLMGIPPKLYHTLITISPNFAGQEHVDPEERRKKMRTFCKKFPIFQLVEKL